jgi:hypothetical protein
MDAVTKLGHYSNCGHAVKHLQPQIAQYFGAVDERVEALHQNGRLDLRNALQRTVGVEEPAEDAAEDHCACSSSLHCARAEVSAPNSITDIHGVCGAVCMHTIPLRGVFCDMRTPEQFCYYLYMLEHIVRARPDIKDVYMDFGCRIRSTWARFIAGHPDLPTEAANVRILVNWMHGSGHDLACQLQNSGRYTDDAGWQVGEEIEQLWSIGKVGILVNP